MAAPKGHPRYGGRTKGTPNKRTRAVREITDRAVRENNITPLSYLIAIVQDESQPQAARMAAAQAAAPYMHPRLSAVMASVEQHNINGKTPEELAAQEAESKRIAIERFEEAFGRGRFAKPEPEPVKEPEPVFEPKPEQIQRTPSADAVMADDRPTRLSRPHRRPRPLGSWSQ